MNKSCNLQLLGRSVAASQQTLNVLHSGTKRPAGLLEAGSCQKGAESLAGRIGGIAEGGDALIRRVQGGQRIFGVVEQHGKDGSASQGGVSDVPINAGAIDLSDKRRCLLGCHLRHVPAQPALREVLQNEIAGDWAFPDFAYAQVQILATLADDVAPGAHVQRFRTVKPSLQYPLQAVDCGRREFALEGDLGNGRMATRRRNCWYENCRFVRQDAEGNMVSRAPIDTVDLVSPSPVPKTVLAMINLGASRTLSAPGRRGTEAVGDSQVPPVVCLAHGACKAGYGVEHRNHGVLGSEVRYACAAGPRHQPKGRRIAVVRERCLNRLGGPGDGGYCVETSKPAKDAHGQFVIKRNRQTVSHDVPRSGKGDDLNRPRLRMTVASARACAGVPSQTSFSAFMSSSLPATASRDTPPTACDTYMHRSMASLDEGDVLPDSIRLIWDWLAPMAWEMFSCVMPNCLMRSAANATADSEVCVDICINMH